MSANAPERIELFSAYAEVFLEGAGSLAELCRFSLPTQRCFREGEGVKNFRGLFSAYAEVFLRLGGHSSKLGTFLCLRRGVSWMRHSPKKRRLFSLPTQRCFLLSSPSYPASTLFSAYAEVFLGRASCRKASCPFLCLRRGVSS